MCTVLVLAFVLPGILYAYPPLAGADDGFVVLSGSMTPHLEPGDVVFVEAVDPETVREGDVITFRARPGSNTLITHRVIEVLDAGGHVRFRTQGDANEDPDPFIVHPDMLVGSEAFTIPWWGLLANLLRSKAGYVLFILLPASLIICREFVVLYRELDARDRRRKKARAEAARGTPAEPTPSQGGKLGRILGGLFLALLVAQPATALLGGTPFEEVVEDVTIIPRGGHLTTLAHMSDNEDATRNFFQAGTWSTQAGFPAQDPGHAYEDADCDGEYDAGTDRRIHRLELEDGEYDSGGQCLVVPPGAGAVTADEVKITTRGGRLLLGTNLTAREGELALESGGGDVHAAGVRLDAAGELKVLADGGRIDLRHAHLASATDEVKVDAGAGPLRAEGLVATTPDEVKLHAGGNADLHGANLESGEREVHVTAGGALQLGAADVRAATEAKLTSGRDMVLENATLTAGEELQLDVTDAANTVHVDGAAFYDRDDAAALTPAEAGVEGTPRHGTITRA